MHGQNACMFVTNTVLAFTHTSPLADNNTHQIQKTQLTVCVVTLQHPSNRSWLTRLTRRLSLCCGIQASY